MIGKITSIFSKKAPTAAGAAKLATQKKVKFASSAKAQPRIPVFLITYTIDIQRDANVIGASFVCAQKLAKETKLDPSISSAFSFLMPRAKMSRAGVDLS